MLKNSFQGLIQPTRLFPNNLFGLSHLSKLLEKRIHPYIRESTILFRKMRNSLRFFSICEIYSRLPSIHNKGYAYSQNHRPLTTLWQSIACASYNILFTSIVTSIFTQDEQTEKIEQECDQKIQAPLLEEIDKINQDRMYPHIQLTSFERKTQNLDQPTNPV